MSQRPYLLSETNWKTVRDTDYQVVVLPWGSTEAHNYHLPYTTDCIESEHVAAEAAHRAWAEGTRVMVLPTVPFGVNTGHLDIKGAINMRPSTQAAVLRDVVHSLSCQGFDRLMVLNGHGGNTFKPLIREVQLEVPDVFVCTVNWYEIGDQDRYFTEPGDHAGELETSAMLQIVPDRVRPLEEAGDGAARTFKVEGLRASWAWAERQWRAVTDDTGVGTPRDASAEKGAAYLDLVTGKIADLLVDLAAADLDDLYA